MEWFLLIILILAMLLTAIGALGLLIWVVDHDFEPAVRVEGVGVSVKDGVVTLKGSVGSYAEKVTANRATKRLADVKGIADEILVKSVGLGTVTRRMVQKRAVEIAFINGRSRHNVLQSDWEQARRELSGGEEMNPKETRLESIPESECWDPLPGSEGHKMPEAASDDEDSEGRSDNESLAEAGIQEAEHEQMLQATSQRKGSGKPRKFTKWPS
jgi:hypothetical protein